MKKHMLLLLLLSRFSRVQLCDPTDGSPPGSPVPGTLQARTLEWGAISFSRGIFPTQGLNPLLLCLPLLHWLEDSLPLHHPGSPL